MRRPTIGTLLGLAVVSGVLAARPAPAVLSTELVTSGLDQPVFATAPPGDTERLFVVEQHTGRIRIVRLGDGSIAPTDFLTIDGVSTGYEQGLLGLAFHPRYATNGLFYVNLTVADGDTEIRRYRVSADPDVADADSGELVLGWTQPDANHNGGWVAFGPDGYLYVSSGDGGSGNDAGSGHTDGTGNAQDVTSNLLGKLLRLDVDGDDFPGDAERNYAVPPTNPFVGVPGDDEIWSYGLRNPWRPSFDRLTGDLYIADVGQSAREEVNVQPAGSSGGENYGWRLREGTIATPGDVGGPRPPGAIDPIYDYTRGDGAFEGFSVTGGYVYRGPFVEMQGLYVFGDYGSARIWSLVWDGSAPATFDGTNHTDLTDRTEELDHPQGVDQISSFAEDTVGHLYVLDLGGDLFRIVSDGPVATTTTTLTPTTTTSTSTTFPPGVTPLSGRKLLVRQKKSGVQLMKLVVRDGAIAAHVPCAVDGELLVEPAGAAVRRYPLAAGLWKPLEARKPERGCAYRGGPAVRQLTLKPGKAIKLVAQVAAPMVPLATDPRPVRLEIRHGEVRHCIEFGGKRGRHKTDRKLVAKRAAVASACPAADDAGG